MPRSCKVSSAVSESGIVLDPPNVMHRTAGQSFERLHNPIAADIKEFQTVAHLTAGSQVQHIHRTIIGSSYGGLQIDMQAANGLPGPASPGIRNLACIRRSS